MSKLVERFLNYVKFDTESNGESDTCPSTGK
jgi:di/tripeptidase